MHHRGASGADSTANVFIAAASQVQQRKKGNKAKDKQRGGKDTTASSTSSVEQPAVGDKRKRKEGKKGKAPSSDYPCLLCNKVGHYAKDCDLLAVAQAAARSTARGELAAAVVTSRHPTCSEISFDSDVAFVTTKFLGNTEVVLDTGATASVFKNSSLLTNLRPADRPITVNGLGGSLQATLEGDFGSFGKVYYTPAAPVD